MKRLIAVLTVAFMAISAGVTGNMLFDLNPVIVGGLSALASVAVPAIAPGLTYLTVFTAPGGIGVAFQFPMTYIPQWLIWNNVVPLTSLRVETQEDGVICDLNAAAIAAVTGFMQVGALPANVVIIPLANGEIKSRNVTVSGVTSAAGAVAFNASSDTKGDAIFKWSNAAILALNPTEFKDFTAIFTPTMAAGDTCQVTYADGHTQIFNIAELAALAAKYQDVPGIILNNANAYIHRAVYQTALATPAYMLTVKRA
jgi:hypothetical protein